MTYKNEKRYKMIFADTIRFLSLVYFMGAFKVTNESFARGKLLRKVFALPYFSGLLGDDASHFRSVFSLVDRSFHESL